MTFEVLQLTPSKITMSVETHNGLVSDPWWWATTKHTINGNINQLEGPWLGLVLRPHMGDRNLKFMRRRCIMRAPDPNVKKDMCWDYVEQTTSTYIHIHSWKLETLFVIYKKKHLQRPKWVYKYNSRFLFHGWISKHYKMSKLYIKILFQKEKRMEPK